MQRDIQQSRLALLSSLMASVFLVAACGGGGGGGSATEAAAEADGARDEVSVEQAAAISSPGTWIADEWKSFTLAAETTVSYGANGKFNTKTLKAGNYSCSNTIFGDPIVGIVKACYKSGSSSAPALASANLTWTASTAPGVTGYRVYYGNNPGSYVQARGNGDKAGNMTSYTTPGLVVGATYYFVVTAVDGAGNESPYSNQVSKVIQ